MISCITGCGCQPGDPGRHRSRDARAAHARAHVPVRTLELIRAGRLPDLGSSPKARRIAERWHRRGSGRVAGGRAGGLARIPCPTPRRPAACAAVAGLPCRCHRAAHRKSRCEESLATCEAIPARHCGCRDKIQTSGFTLTGPMPGRTLVKLGSAESSYRTLGTSKLARCANRTHDGEPSQATRRT
jgi:hypothetical protein